MRSQNEFSQIYKKYYPAILKFLRFRVGVAEVAEDLAGEVFYKAWRGRDGFRQGTLLQAWLFRIAHNTLVDYWRKKKDIPMDLVEQSQIASVQPSVQESAELQDELWRLSRALDQLSGAMKSVAILRFIEGMPAKEVAALLGMTEGNVRIVQFRALAKLRKHMNDGN